MNIYLLTKDEFSRAAMRNRIEVSLNRLGQTSTFIEVDNLTLFYKRIFSMEITSEDVFFIDIDLAAPFNGIDIAKRLLARFIKVKVIFLAEHPNQAIPAINCNCRPLAYILKNSAAAVLEGTLYTVLKFVVELYEQEVLKEGALLLQSAREEVLIPHRKISYISCIKGNRNEVLVQTSNKQLVVKGRISNLKEELTEAGFSQSLRTYIINLKNVDRISRTDKVVHFKNLDSLELGIKIIDKIRKEIIDSTKMTENREKLIV